MKNKLLTLIVIMLCNTIAFAQPTQPILRIETGMHNSAGFKIASDSSGHFLLTCSHDKTARIWDATTGRLLNILRIPIGLKNDGKLFACALSPDGRIAALGGWTGFNWDSSATIYLLSAQTGELIHRIKGMPDVIFDLKFSLDGQWLGAGLGKGGVYIFDTKTWTQYKRLDGYHGSLNNITFYDGNCLATACNDGIIRLYNSNFVLAKQAETGKKIHSISFNPSGNLLAVGYEDDTTLEVRDAQNLSVIYNPEFNDSNHTSSGLCNLCFSNDGRTLFGGGRYSIDSAGMDKAVLRLWNNLGKGSYFDIPMMINTITDIKPLPNGNIAIIGAYPDIGVVSSTGVKIWYQKAKTNDFRADDKSHFRVNETGDVIGFTPDGEKPAGFNIRTRNILTEAVNYPIPETATKRTTITEWRETISPSINGNKILSWGKEQCYSANISVDGSKLFFCGNTVLYRYDEQGEKIWETQMPQIAYSLNISGNNKVEVAGLGDGTIRWYNVADGKELLAFYLNSDLKRWVLFTPQGYYDASPGAEDFLGWHVNNGPDKAPSFYPVSRFRSEFYRPDIIDAIFKTYNEDSAIALANQALHACHSEKIIEQRGILEMLPPVVSIRSPQNLDEINEPVATIHYSINNPSGTTLKGMRVLINGRPVPTARGAELINDDNGDHRVQITLSEGENKVTLLAENNNGFSPAATVTLKYKAKTAASKGKPRPKLYALVIGISAYDNADYKLMFASADAKSFTDALKKQKGKQYADVAIKQLLDKEATLSNIRQGLTWIQNQTGPGDVAMIFYAGHGINENNLFYLLPSDANISNLYTCLNDTTLVKAVSNIAGNVVVFLDACHSGNVMSQCSKYTDANIMINQLIGNENGLVVFTASTGREFAYEYPEIKHGAFTKALIEGFEGKAAPYSPDITISTLDAYNKFRVKQLTNDKQHPTMVVPQNLPDFNIGLK